MSTFARMETSTCDLTEVEARQGDGDARLTALEFLTPEREPKKIVRSGDPIVFRFHYEVRKEIPISRFGIQIDTALGTMISNIGTFNMGLHLETLEPGKGYIDLEIDVLNLMPARYYLSLYVASPGPVWHDRLDHCIALDVEASDYYGTGRGIDSRFGLVFFPCRWTEPVRTGDL
jgi:hypothetical protein